MFGIESCIKYTDNSVARENPGLYAFMDKLTTEYALPLTASGVNILQGATVKRNQGNYVYNFKLDKENNPDIFIEYVEGYDMFKVYTGKDQRDDVHSSKLLIVINELFTNYS